MATDHVAEILNQALCLSPSEQARLLEGLQAIVPGNGAGSQHSILELKGLGRDLWNGIDGQEYVRQERDAWNG
jgi:hypothetical protein